MKRCNSCNLESILFVCINRTRLICYINLYVQATSLLKKNLENAKASLEVLIADLQFLRDQVTITQVVLVFYKITFLFLLAVLLVSGDTRNPEMSKIMLAPTSCINFRKLIGCRATWFNR